MKDDRLPQDKDRHLDVPSEARRDKHINFVDLESADANSENNRKDKETEDRQREWKEGLEEGKRARNNE